MDSILAAINFARAALESAVWAHATSENWTWHLPVPGRCEDKYEMWGHLHPLTYDIFRDPTAMESVLSRARVRPPRAEDVEF